MSCDSRSPGTDYMIQRMQYNGWVVMNAFCDRLGRYNLSLHRWDTGEVITVHSSECWRSAICDAYYQWYARFAPQTETAPPEQKAPENKEN